MNDLRTAAQQALEALAAMTTARCGGDDGMDISPINAAYDKAESAITALRAALAQQAEPVLQTCNCRWDGEVQVQQCTLHEAHVDAIHEWAERAKVAERKLAQQAEPVLQGPVRIKPGSYTLGATWVGGGGGSGGVGAPPQQAEPERHFCERCGKRLSQDGIHTCTPPQQAEPVEPVAWVHTDAQNPRVRFLEWTQQAKGYRGDWIKTPLCNCAPPRQTDPQIEDRLARHGIPMPEGDPK